jgi:hypothetical protein
VARERVGVNGTNIEIRDGIAVIGVNERAT